MTEASPLARYAVIGNPIAHSRSPQIHALFSRQTGKPLSYERLLAPVDGFTAAVAAFAAEGGLGLNVTVPFKQEAYALAAGRLSSRARLAGAVNTLSWRDGAWHGCNTDGVGLVSDLLRLGVRLSGDYPLSGMLLQPYARANVWHTKGGQNTVTFADVTDIVTEQKSTTMGVSLGANLKVASGISLYGEVGYNRNLDSNTFNGRRGTVGLRMEF